MFAKIVKTMQNIQVAVGGICITIFFVVIVIQVFCRYLNITVTWTGEVSTYSFIWAVFMGAGAMTYENKHFAFTSFIDKLSFKNRQVVDLMIHGIIMIFTLSILYFGMIITRKFWNYQWINLPFIKMGYTWLCVPILGFTGTIYSINSIINAITKLLKKESEVRS